MRDVNIRNINYRADSIYDELHILITMIEDDYLHHLVHQQLFRAENLSLFIASLITEFNLWRLQVNEFDFHFFLRSLFTNGQISS